ncbi:MAG: thioredoxin domain-containing protein [Gammaproteobacteria bacterium]
MTRVLPRVLSSLLLLAACSLLQAGVTQAGKTGGWRLAAESSPYLNMHADNPVEWYPWGEQAFAKARRENKPLFISIGYFTCHWCHVMARESFEDPAIARLLNENFVSIKIDREQRPDIDDAYMRYVTLTQGRGGWPMSVWATPDGDPFVGGTYFPPHASMGKNGMDSLLPLLAALWKDDEAGIRETAQQAVAMMRKLGGGVEPLQKLGDDVVVRAHDYFAAAFDELQGGFEPAPKFPQPARLMFLLESPQQAAADMALFTLDRMAAGGIHDHLAGGFHRYSTDFDWRVPHFEKMLYDQALIARACLFAWRRSREDRYAAITRETLDFSLVNMRGADGGFYSALGADSPLPDEPSGHMEEGAYYTWSWQQLTGALGDGPLRDWAVARYGLSELGNAVTDPLGEMQGKNVLYAALDTKELANKFKLDLISVRQRNARVDELLRKARTQRPAVPVDDKVVTVWNGYMVTTLALAGRALDEPRYIEAAEKTAGFLFDALVDKKTGVLYRDWRNGVRGVPGFGEDYAALAEGLLALYKVTADKHWLVRAQALVDKLLADFRDESVGGFFNSPANTELWLRGKQASDGATLSVNGIAVHVLYEMARLTGQQAYLDKARKTAAWAGAKLADSPASMPYMLIVWSQLTDNAKKE